MPVGKFPRNHFFLDEYFRACTLPLMHQDPASTATRPGPSREGKQATPPGWHPARTRRPGDWRESR